MSQQSCSNFTGAVDALEERRLLRQAQSLSRVGSWRYDLIAERLLVSAVVPDLLGLAVVPDGGHTYLDYADVEPCIDSDDRAQLRRTATALMRRGGDATVRFAARRVSDGRRRSFDARVVTESDQDGRVTHLAGTLADVSEIVAAEAQLRTVHAELIEANKHQQSVIEATPDAIHVYDVATASLVRGNRSGKPLIGFTAPVAAVLSGTDVDVLVPSHDRRQLAQLFSDARGLADSAVAQLRHRVRHDHGDVRWLSRRVTPFARDGTGFITELLVISRDVSDVVAVEQRLKHAALHDDLTGLANRHLAHDRLNHSLRRTVRGGHVAVLVCDLDGFKRINDAYGHLVGDLVLTETAARMAGATRPADTIARRAGDDPAPVDTIARMGGDEFTVILDIPQHDNPRLTAQRIAQRIATAIAHPFAVEGRELRMSVSIGIAIAGDVDDAVADAEALLNDADAAMYHIKTRGGNGYAFYEPSHRPDTTSTDQLEHHIRRALAAEDGIDVHYQPIIDPRTDAIHGVEALLRIRDDTGRFLDTAQVVAVAERTGLIGEIDARVLHLACAQAAAWRRDPALGHLMLEVNRSVRDITRPGFYQRVTDALATSGLDPRALTLEITETVLLDATPTDLNDLKDLHQLGIGLAIDDFGTGYASLRYLAELPITCIKIDQSFTNRLPADPTAMTLVRATVSLAEQLHINCVVEGVETAEQLAALPPYQRLLVQGYFYAAPQSADQPLEPHIRPVRAGSYYDTDASRVSL